MSRKSRRPAPKPSPQELRLLPFASKVAPDRLLSRTGKTDTFYRLSNRRLGDLVLREAHMPGGDVYDKSMTTEKVATRSRELRHYEESAWQHGISVVEHLDIVAQKNNQEPAGIWTIAARVPGGRTVHDLLVAKDPRAFAYQKRIMEAGVEYCIAAADDEERAVVITDIVKPSQFVVQDDESLVMVDTNPPLWTRRRGIDSTVSEVFIQGMAINVLTRDPEAVDIGVAAIETLAETGLVTRAIRSLVNTREAIETFYPGHPQIELMQRVGLDMLLERPTAESS